MKRSPKSIKTFLLAVLALNLLGPWTVTGANCHNDSFQKTIESIEFTTPDYNAPFIGNSFSVQNTDQVFVAAVDNHNNYEYIFLNFQNQIKTSLKSLGNNFNNPTLYVTMLRKSNFNHRLSSQDSPATV